MYTSIVKKWVLKFASYKSPDDIFNLVLEGKKTIETRPVNPESSKNYATIKVGDKVILQSVVSKRKVEKEISFVHVYKSISDMVINENEDSIFPGIGSKDNLIEAYEILKKKWGKSYAQKLEKYGIVALGLK